MNRSLSICTLSIVALLCGGAAAHAQVSLSLHDAGGNLSELRVGDTATVEVRLSGVQPGQELDTLAAVVVYNGSRLGSPAITGGPILPAAPFFAWDFLEMGQPGYAEASFSTIGEQASHHITSDGLFCSFDVTAAAPGRGALSFDFTDATQFNPDDPLDPTPLTVTEGDPLSFTVVPEPNAMAMLMALLMPLLWRR